jgi:hypothetical protein
MLPLFNPARAGFSVHAVFVSPKSIDRGFTTPAKVSRRARSGQTFPGLGVPNLAPWNTAETRTNTIPD